MAQQAEFGRPHRDDLAVADDLVRDRIELDIGIGEEFAGKGLMSEAVGVLLPYFFDTLGLHRLQAAFLPHNQASRRVLEKNGFREEGYAENYLQIDGRWADHVLFAITRERWDARPRVRP